MDIVFVGVTTGSSLVHRALPAWQGLLGSAWGLRGVDIDLGADDGTYARLLDDLRSDETVSGAVVTSGSFLASGSPRLTTLREDFPK